jgi:hypothetical protein
MRKEIPAPFVGAPACGRCGHRPLKFAVGDADEHYWACPACRVITLEERTPALRFEDEFRHAPIVNFND